MYEIKFKNSKNKEFYLNDESKYVVTDISGLNPPDTTLTTMEVANVDGTIWKSSRIGEREIVIKVVLRGDIETNRIKLFKFFGAKKDLIFYYKNNTYDVYIGAYIEKVDCDYFAKMETVQITLICPQPYFTPINNVQGTLDRFINKFEFPFSRSVEEGTIADYGYSSIVIDNNGEYDTGAIFTITSVGQVNNITLYNNTTNEEFNINTTLNNGEKIILNTNQGSKSIKKITTDDQEVNLMPYVSGSWIQIIEGENKITYTAITTNSSDFRINIEVKELIAGV